MKYYDIVNLSSGHSLICPHAPKILTMQQVEDVFYKNGIDIEKFGLFDTATPSFSNYYPDVKAEDLAPKEEDFIQPIFRALSEVIVHKKYNPIDFGAEPNILKNSMPLFVGQTVYANHEASVGNELGAIADSSWQSNSTQNGVKVPAGINVRLMVDGKSNPKIARGIMSEPPSVHSVSATVAFEYRLSHPEMTSDEFYNKLGTYDKEGEMYRRIVTNISRYTELSLVAHGADPFAQKIGKDGKINNPTFAGVTYNSETRIKPFVFFDYKTDLVNLSENDTIPNELIINKDNNLQIEAMNEHLITLAALYNIDSKTFEGREAELAEAIRVAKTQSDTDLASLSTIKTSLTEANTKITNLTTELAELKTKSDSGIKALSQLKTETIKLHKLANKGNEDANIVKLINDGTYESIQGFNTQFTDKVDDIAPLSCQTCGSTEVERKSVQVNKELNKPSNADPIKPKTHLEVMESFQSPTRKKTTLYGAKPVEEKEK